ncbi:MAG: HPr kinase/phosphorylase, partial [Oscillospiraceae bacterium]|nr:HPr kinase/phosphorylase [Oscillospiraceae bacterium]
MDSNRSVKLSELVEEYRLEVLRKGKDYEKFRVTTEDVSRPGLQLSGYFDYFDADRIQIIGKIECTYLEGMTSERRREAFGKLFSLDIPALIISRGMEPFPECMEMAEKYDRTILRSQQKTTAIQGALFTGLRNQLAPRITRHGVLMEIYGEGVFLTGESGVG